MKSNKYGDRIPLDPSVRQNTYFCFLGKKGANPNGLAPWSHYLSLNSFKSTTIGEASSASIWRVHSSTSEDTSLITICVWSAFHPHRRKLPCSVNSTVRHTGQLPSNLMEQPIILQCNGIVGSGSLITTQARSVEWKSRTVKSAGEYSMKSFVPFASGSI